MLVAAGIFAAISNRESLGAISLPSLPSVDSIADSVTDTLVVALDELVDGLAKVPGLDAKTLANVQDAIDDFLFDLLQR